MASYRLSNFPNLESFEFIFNESCPVFTNSINEDLNESIIQFFEFLLREELPKLQFITISHEKDTNKGKQMATHSYDRYKFYCDMDTSLRICKLIIALSTSTDMSIKTIGLAPIILMKGELEYLEFWFGDGNEFGSIQKMVYAKSRGVYIMNMVITNK